MNQRLGELLVKAGKLTREQLQQGLAIQKEKGGRLGMTLVQLGLIEDEELVEFLSKQYGVPAINLHEIEIDDSIIRLIPSEVSRKYTVLPVSKAGAKVTIAMADPTNVFAMDDIKFITGYNVEPVVASDTALRAAIDRYYGSTHAIELKKVMEDLTTAEAVEATDLEVLEEEQDLDLAALEQQSEEAPVVRLVNIILTDAIKRGASDIHIEPYERAYRVRYRIDGVLYEMMRPPIKLREAITSRIKIMARLDIAEKRLPQDGRIKIKTKLSGKVKDLDYRVSVLPTIFGEKIVLRLLDKDNLNLDMAKLGFEPDALRRFEEAILRPYGMVLVTGPTGSGKTNTLYSALSRINTLEVNIMTAEDPVEFNMPGINQVQMKEQIGLNFATALRSFLRQDPNIVLVGEIRDFETAEVAIKAAMTGHLVLSTLHTNDAPSSINRLMNMGIEPFLVATSVHLVAAQRLVRRVCRFCKQPAPVADSVLMNAGFSKDEARSLKLFRGAGCERCSQTGYKGRIGLFEVLEINDEVRELILSGASAYELRQKARQNGMTSLRESGLQKVRDGMTTLEEVVRETVAYRGPRAPRPMPRITRVYTRTGDDGTTALADGRRIGKDEPRVAAFGTVDELSSQLGAALASGLAPPLPALLGEVQNTLFHLGAELSSPPGEGVPPPGPRVEPRHVAALEGQIDRLTQEVGPLANFILPGGSPGAAHLHVARTVCRRAERLLVALGRREPVGSDVLAYLNRLSDALFVMARYENLRKGIPETLWDSRA